MLVFDKGKRLDFVCQTGGNNPKIKWRVAGLESMAKKKINYSTIGEEIRKCAEKHTSCLHCLEKNGICPKYGKHLVVRPLYEEDEAEK